MSLTPEEKKELEEQAKKAISAVKLRLLSQDAKAIFFTTLVCSFKHEVSWDVPTAATNGIKVRYNPEFFMSLSKEERTFIILHETLHIAYFHVSRIGDRDIQRWNAATDLVINAHLKDQGYTMPKGGLYNKKFAGLSAEEIYDKITTFNIPIWADLESGGNPNGNGDGEAQGGLTQAEINEVENALVKASLQAEINGADFSSIPGDLLRKIQDLTAPKLPWFKLLRRFLNQTKKEDYSWRKPNKRYMPDYYLPSLYSEGMGEVVIAIDTSGSISEEDFTIFISEVASIFKMLKPSCITLIQFDYGITSITKIKDIKELLKVEFKGGGGTDINEVVNWINDRKNIQFAIWFTDGFFSDPLNKNTIPTFWITYNNPEFKPDFGKVIEYDLHK